MGRCEHGDGVPGAPLRIMAVSSSRSFSGIYAGCPDQVGEARRLLAVVLHGCPVAEDAVLLCSELCANAVCHSNSGRPGGQFTVRAEVYDRDYVHLEVEDQGGPWLERTRSGERGHGLTIVRAIADAWGIDGGAEGWVVWVRI